MSNYRSISDFHFGLSTEADGSGKFMVVDMLLDDDARHIGEMMQFEVYDVATNRPKREGHPVREAKIVVCLWDAPGRTIKTWWPSVAIAGVRRWPSQDAAVNALLGAASRLSYVQLRSQVDAWERKAQAADRSPGTVTLLLPRSGTTHRAHAKSGRKHNASPRGTGALAAVAGGHRITRTVTDAMSAAGFRLTSQGGNVFSYARQLPGGAREYIVSSRDHNPPTSLSEAVDLAREDADGQPVGGRSFRTLRQALAASKPRATGARRR